MPFKNGNSSGWWVSIHRNANYYELPEINLQWRRPTWYMDTDLLKLTLRNTLVYPSIDTQLGPHTSMPQPRRPMELEPSSSATYARRQLQWRRTHSNPSSAQSLNTPVCGLGPPQRPRCKQARDGTTPVRPIHIPGLWSNQQHHGHPENSRLGTPSGTPREGPHHHDVQNSSWSCWHPGIGPHHTGTCKQKERQCPFPRAIRADFGIAARNLPRRHAPVERHPKWGYRSRKHRHLKGQALPASRPMLRSLQHPVNSHFCTYMHLFLGVVDTFSHTHTVCDTLVWSCTISEEEEPTAPAVFRPWLKPNEYYRGGDYI